MTQVVGRRAHHAQLADELVGRDERLARDVATALGHDLVLEVRGRDAGVEVELDRALYVEEVAVARVHVHHDGRDVEVGGGDLLLRVADRHRQLELAERGHRAARAVRDLHRRVEVHVRRAEVADGERVAAEVDRVEAVVHDELPAHRVIDARRKDVRLLRQQAAKALARVLVARRGDLEPTRKKGRLDELHGLPPSYSFSWSQLQGSGHSHSCSVPSGSAATRASCDRDS